MTSTPAAIAARRQQVGALWLRGESTVAIATQLDTPERTIRRDLAAVRAELERASLVSLEAKRARSVSSLRALQAEAWRLYGRLEDTSSNKVGALNSIISAEASIARLEGTATGDHINQTVNIIGGAEWQTLRGLILSALASHPEAKADVVRALMAAKAAEGEGEQDDDDAR